MQLVSARASRTLLNSALLAEWSGWASLAHSCSGSGKDIRPCQDARRTPCHAMAHLSAAVLLLAEVGMSPILFYFEGLAHLLSQRCIRSRLTGKRSNVELVPGQRMMQLESAVWGSELGTQPWINWRPWPRPGSSVKRRAAKTGRGIIKMDPSYCLLGIN
jgi:hypothetical protein